MTYSFNQIIEYIDGTRDLNFEAARKWAQENGATFEEDVSKREPYEQEHEETYMNSETGSTETRVVKSPSIKRFFVIGEKPAPAPEPTQEEKEQAIRDERNLRLTFTDWTQLPDAPLTAETKAAWAAYRQALRDVPEQAGFPDAIEWPEEP